MGSGPLSRLQGKAAGIILQGLRQSREVAFAEEIVNCHRSGVLGGAQIHSEPLKTESAEKRAGEIPFCSTLSTLSHLKNEKFQFDLVFPP